MARRATSVAAVLLFACALAGCGRDSVELSFRPAPGTTVRYETTTQARTHTEAPGTAPDVEQTTVMDITHRVLGRRGEATTVQVDAAFRRLVQNGVPAPVPDAIAAVFEVDRRGHALSAMTATTPAAELARRGLPEITGPFPEGGVRPGMEWTFPPPLGRSGFGGRAALLKVTSRGGVPMAEISATLSVTLADTEIRGRDGPVTIGGPLTLSLRGLYEIATGVLVESHEELHGEFRLRFSLQGSPSPPVTGTQTLVVTSDTRRI